MPKLTAAAIAVAMPASKLLTPKHVAHIFDVSLMTVCNWRKGTPTYGVLKTTPVKNSPRNVGFKVSEIKRWAKTNNLPMRVQPDKLLGESIQAPKIVMKKAATAIKQSRPKPSKLVKKFSKSRDGIGALQV